MIKFLWIPVMILLFLAGCAKDIVLDEDTGLVGVYSANYTYVQDFGSSNATTTNVKLVWNFVSDKAFNYTVDNDDPFTDPDHGVCDASGDYLRNTVNDITFLNVTPSAGSVCDDATLVQGLFNYKTEEGDIVVDLIVDSPPTFYSITLVKVVLE